MRKAYAALQCISPGDRETVGSFLYAGADSQKDPAATLVSPVFDRYYQLLDWINANQWTQAPYDPDHPVGVYVQKEAA